MTTDQLALELSPLVVPEYAAEATIEERFGTFVEHNPDVLHDLIAIIEDAKRNGCTRYGVKAAYEVLRWHHFRLTDDQPFRLNNDYTSRFSRLIIQRRPDLAPLLRTRELKAA